MWLVNDSEQLTKLSVEVLQSRNGYVAVSAEFPAQARVVVSSLAVAAEGMVVDARATHSAALPEQLAEHP